MNKIVFCISSLAVTFLTSCHDDDSLSNVSISYTLPVGHEADAIVGSPVISVEDVASGSVTSYSFDDLVSNTVSLPYGLYNMTLTVNTSHPYTDRVVDETFRDVKQGVQVDDGDLTVSFSPIRVSGGQGFVFAEMCFASQLPEGLSSYSGDAWFRIINNSSDTLCADGLCIVESAFSSVNNGKHDYQPDIMSDAMAVMAVYQIPGAGNDVQVLPGGSLLIADVAKDHRADNPLSFDLSKADFEWYDDVSSSVKDIDTDVPNLVCVYKQSKTFWVPNKQYNKSYAIGYLGGEFGRMTNDDYIASYKYDCSYVTIVKETEKEMKCSYYRFENEWILDAVSFAPSKDFGWSIIDQSLDAGYVSMGETGTDKSRLGKSARRKFERGLMVDTNNSSDDFIVASDADPSHLFK